MRRNASIPVLFFHVAASNERMLLFGCTYTGYLVIALQAYFNKAKIAAFGSALLPRINESGGNEKRRVMMTNVLREVDSLALCAFSYLSEDVLSRNKPTATATICQPLSRSISPEIPCYIPGRGLKIFPFSLYLSYGYRYVIFRFHRLFYLAFVPLLRFVFFTRRR